MAESSTFQKCRDEAFKAHTAATKALADAVDSSGSERALRAVALQLHVEDSLKLGAMSAFGESVEDGSRGSRRT